MSGETILALDTSSKAGSCALLRDGALLGEFFVNTALTHSQTAMPMVQSLLEITGVAIDQVDRFAVSTGPGSFTGLRIGIAAVKGMALATGKPCGGVSTLEGLAWNLAAFQGIVAPAMDARRSQVYTALFRMRDGELTRLEEDSALSLPELGERLAAISEPVMLVGDGAKLCRDALPERNLLVAAEPLLHQRAGSVAVAVARLPADKLCSAQALAPAYLRLPQAERERLAKLER